MVSSINSTPIANNQMTLNNLRNTQQNFNATVSAPENNLISNKVKDAQKSPLTSVVLFIGSWLGLSKGADYFNKHTSGNYYDSVIGKIGKFGDKVAETSAYQGVAKACSTPLNWIKNVWKNHSESNTFLRILKNPAEREWKFAKAGPAYGYIDEITMDVIDVMRGFKNKYGEEVFKKAFGGRNYEYFEKFNDCAHKYAPELESALQKAIKYCKDNGIKDESLLNDIPMLKTKFRLPKIMSRNASLSESYNKLQMAKGLKNTMHKSALGRLLPKWTCKVVEGLSNGTAGGKIAIAMQASILADAVYRAYKAPKGEKVSTFMETMTNDVTMYMMIPIYTQFFNRVGGLKYAGMTTAQKLAYQNHLKAFNETAKKGILTSANYLSGKKAVKNLANAGSKWYLKPLRWIGKISNYGCERIYPYIQKGKGFSNLFKKVGYHLKGAAGIGRAIFAFAVIGPILAKPIVKVSHMIFGKPTESILDEDKKDAQKEAAAHSLDKNSLYAPAAAQAINNLLTPQEVAILKQKGLNDEQIMQVAAYKQQMIATEQKLSELEQAKPLEANSLLKKPIGAEKLQGVRQASSAPRSYVPSSKCKVQPQNVVIPQHVGMLLNRADAVEQDAMNVLKGNK